MSASACAFAFRSADPVDFEPSAEQRLIVATVRDFVIRELYPHEAEVERLDEVPADLAAAIRDKAIAAGLYAANMPADLGGGGLDAVSVVLVERELGRASYALQMLVERPSNILRACNGEQRERYLLPAIRGERHDCVAMTEPAAGSDVRSMTTAANAGRRGLCHQRDQALHQPRRRRRLCHPVRRHRSGAYECGSTQPYHRTAGGLRCTRTHDQPRTGLRLEPRLPPVRAELHRLPGACIRPARRGRPRPGADEPMARRKPADSCRHQHRGGPSGCSRRLSTGPPGGVSSASRSASSRASGSSWPTWRRS